MQFTLKSLLLATAVLPLVAWLIYRARYGGEHPELLPDPLGTLGVIAWVSIYYSCVHKRMPNC